MDDIPHLSEFQTILRSADSQYPFATLKRREGNEEKIKYIVKRVENFFSEKRPTPDFEQKRKLALYLVLNAELPALEEMSGLAGGVGALVRTLPALPGPLLSALLWGTSMWVFVDDMVAFCRPALALQLADACIANLQPDDLLRHPVDLAGALYQLMCRLHFARAPPSWAHGAALAGLRACLVHLDRMYQLNCNKSIRFVIFLFMTKLIETCYNLFTSFQKLEVSAFADIYWATHEPDGLAPEALEFKICDSPDRAISESLRACNALLLDHCVALVTNVSVDILSVSSDSDMQRSIGEVCYRMNAILRRIPDAADHRLVRMLARFSKEPRDLSMVIDVMDPDVIAVKIRARDASSAAWLNALLDQKRLCCHPTLLQVFLSKAATLNEDQSAQLYKNIIRLSNGFTEDAALRRRVAIEAYRRCSDSYKDHFLAEQFREYFHDDLMTVDFEAALSVTFDLLVVGVVGPGDALAVFVQNPRRTLERLVRTAGDGAAQTEPMLRIVERLGDCRERCYRGQSEPALVLAVNAVLDDAAATEDDARRRHLGRFVEELVRRRLLREELLRLRQSTPEARA